MKKNKLARLIEKEKLLYLEVEQLRYRLFLHNTSILFEILSAFYFAGHDISRLFLRKKRVQSSPVSAKKLSIISLQRKKRFLIFLSNTPYAWILYVSKALKQAFWKVQSIAKQKRGVQSQKKKAFLIFGTTGATDLQSRSVQIARTLAKKAKVVYIEGQFDEGNRPGYRVVEESLQFTALRLSAKKSIHLSYQKPSPKEISFLKKSLRLSTFDFKTLDFITYIHHPFWISVFPFKKNTYLFDHAESFLQQGNAVQYIILAEKKAVKNALIITAPHRNLLRSTKDIIVKNGVEWGHFKDTSKMIQTCDVGLCWIKKPVMGYIGTLDEKIDADLLGHLATVFPTASIVLVGNTDYRPVIEVAEQYPNIFPVGKQLYKKLPLFLQSFDIIIVPFKQQKQGSAVYPELPLALASGKPIVAPSAATLAANGAIYQPKSHTDWSLAIAEALKEKKRSKKRSLRIAAAKRLSWRISNLINNANSQIIK